MVNVHFLQFLLGDARLLLCCARLFVASAQDRVLVDEPDDKGDHEGSKDAECNEDRQRYGSDFIVWRTLRC